MGKCGVVLECAGKCGEVRGSVEKSLRFKLRNKGGVNRMPLTEKVEFIGRLQRRNQVQIPRLIRWRYKLELWQILKVTVYHPYAPGLRGEYFTRMGKDGRITVPKLTVVPLIGNRLNQGPCLLNVTLEQS